MKGTMRENHIIVKKLTVAGQDVTGGIVLSSGQTVDLNGIAGGLILDADADTTIDSNTDDTINIKISGASDFTFTANTFNSLSGSTIKTNTIAETTAASGVTIDSVLLKDGGAVFADGATIEVDTVNEATAAAGVTADGVLLKDGGIVCADAATLEVDTVNEATAGAGVTLDSVLCKDGAVKALDTIATVTADGAVAVPTGNTTFFITENADGATMTLVDPTATTHDGLRLTFISTTAQAHSLDLVTGINGGAADVGTWGGAVGDAVAIIAYQGVWYALPGQNVNVTWA